MFKNMLLMQNGSYRNLLVLLFSLINVFFLVMCPYTKVEESFNLQAIHDLIYCGKNVSCYDHIQFPGVVPRTFIGPITLYLMSLPLQIMSYAFGKFCLQYIARATLCLLVISGVSKFSSSAEKVFGRQVALYFLAISCTQFHLSFYSSRPLPNIFALVLVLHALAAWLEKNMTLFIWLAGLSIIFFRFELILLFGVCFLVSLIKNDVSIFSHIDSIIKAGVCGLVTTFMIDRYFWQRWLWPESEVMYFNLVLNKSSDYGVSPFHWYFTSALPRALLSSMIFIPWGLRSDFSRCVTILLPALSFVTIFSLLPHKELRFIIYTFPLFNLVAAKGYFDLHLRRSKGIIFKVIHLGALLLLIANILCTSLFFFASYNNYPGGNIFRKLHSTIPCSPNNPIHIHIGNLAAQTGISRFGETCEFWTYNKTEFLSITDLQNSDRISHVIAEYNEDENLLWKKTHTALLQESVFAGYELVFPRNINTFPLKIKTLPSLLVWQK